MIAVNQENKDIRMKQIKPWIVATILGFSSLAVNAFASMSIAVDAAESIAVDAAELEGNLPDPTVFSEPDFNFTDCNGKPFNTKDINNSIQTEEQTACYAQGIVNTKFDFDGEGKALRSVLQLSQFEKNQLLDNAKSADPRAVYALFVYMTVTELSEYNHLLDYNDQ